MSIAENLARVRDRIAAAARRSRRSPDAITLVAVSKYVDAAIGRQLLEAGCHNLGEARPQELWRKAEALSGTDVRWHLIGHLQTNKVRRTLPLVSLIHSIDNEKLLDVVNIEAAAIGHRMSVLLEVNISGDKTKHGFQPDSVGHVIERAGKWQQVQIRGLMGMAALDGGPEMARRNFASLRELRDRLTCNCPPETSLAELSMGMSGDYEIAIEEGATMVRIGSVLFEGVAL
jgi:PLP dependent protein